MGGMELGGEMLEKWVKREEGKGDKQIHNEEKEWKRTINRRITHIDNQITEL